MSMRYPVLFLIAIVISRATHNYRAIAYCGRVVSQCSSFYVLFSKLLAIFKYLEAYQSSFITDVDKSQECWCMLLFYPKPLKCCQSIFRAGGVGRSRLLSRESWGRKWQTIWLAVFSGLTWITAKAHEQCKEITGGTVFASLLGGVNSVGGSPDTAHGQKLTFINFLAV